MAQALIDTTRMPACEALFHGAPTKHIAEYYERIRMERINANMRAAYRRIQAARFNAAFAGAGTAA